VGAIVPPGTCTVAAMLSVRGWRQRPHLRNFPRVLTRACWSSRAVRQTLWRVLSAVFVPQGLLVLGLDDPVKRRRGKKNKAKGS